MHDSGRSAGEKHGSERNDRLVTALSKKLIHNRLHLRMIRWEARGNGDKVDQVLALSELDGHVDFDAELLQSFANASHPLGNDGFEKIRIFPWVICLLQAFSRNPIVEDGQHRLSSGLEVDFFVEPIPSEPDFLTLFGRKNFPDALDQGLAIGCVGGDDPFRQRVSKRWLDHPGPIVMFKGFHIERGILLK
ncbi:MAG: hypothetical protein WBG10_17540, partial [Pseudolabrys sp.]